MNNDNKKPRGYWNNYDNCLNESKKYKTKNEFKLGNSEAYKKAIKNGWINDYNFEKPKVSRVNKWTEDSCKKEAEKYKSRSEFRKNSNRAYEASKRNGWIDSFTWLAPFPSSKPINFWTYDKCIEESKKYKTRGEFSKKSPYVYGISLRKGWLDTFSWLVSGKEEGIKKVTKYTYQVCYDEAKKYKTIKEFEENSKRICALRITHGLLNLENQIGLRNHVIMKLRNIIN